MFLDLIQKYKSSCNAAADFYPDQNGVSFMLHYDVIATSQQREKLFQVVNFSL